MAAEEYHRKLERKGPSITSAIFFDTCVTRQSDQPNEVNAYIMRQMHCTVYTSRFCYALEHENNSKKWTTTTSLYYAGERQGL